MKTIAFEDMNNLKTLTSNIQDYLESAKNESGIFVVENLTTTIHEKINTAAIIGNEYVIDKNLAYSILAYLSFIQTFFASKIKESQFQNQAVVSIYWKAVSLKDCFRVN